MTYKLNDHVTKEMLREEFFDKNMHRGIDMGWEHHVTEDRTVVFTRSDAEEKYKKLDGLELFIKDIIKLGYIKKIK